MKLPPYSDKQEEIIKLLYQFRYLLVNQFLKLFNQSDRKWIQELLDNLVDKKYIAQIKDKEIADGYIYCLDTRAGHILKIKDDTDEKVLGRLHKEKTNGAPFIKKQIFICAIYLYFLSQKTKRQELSFFTSQELRGHNDFPEPLPSAYIELVERKETNRYFLEYFDEYTIHKVVRDRVQYYLNYRQGGNWQSNTDESFPTVIFVLPTEKFKKHIQYYSNAIFEKNLGDDIDLYLTTKQEIKTGQVNWDEVKKEE